MFYLLNNNSLKPLDLDAKDAISFARSYGSILVTNKIEEAIEIADYSKAAFLMHSKNLYSIFGYWKLQLKHHTFKEFHIIVYAASGTWLSSLLRLFAKFSMGNYKFIDFAKIKSFKKI